MVVPTSTPLSRISSGSSVGTTSGTSPGRSPTRRTETLVVTPRRLSAIAPSLPSAARGGRGQSHDTGLSSLVQLVSRWRYLCGLALDAAGFLAAFTALQTLPL